MERNILLVENDRMVTSDTLENVVRAANIAGYMEKEDKIDVPDDQQLMQCIVSGYNTWDNLQDPPSWDEFIEAKLLETFGPKMVYLLCMEFGKPLPDPKAWPATVPYPNVVGIFSSKEAAEKKLLKLKTGKDDGDAGVGKYCIVEAICKD